MHYTNSLIATAIAGAIALGPASTALEAQATVDVENQYPNVGVLMVWRVDDAGKPVELRGFASGTLILSGEKQPCAPAALRIITPREAELTLTEGRYHQVRRMFSSGGANVVTLHRLSFGSLELGDLPAGKWRELSLNTFD